jgi:hypothetical protein
MYVHMCVFVVARAHIHGYKPNILYIKRVCFPFNRRESIQQKMRHNRTLDHKISASMRAYCKTIRKYKDSVNMKHLTKNEARKLKHIIKKCGNPGSVISSSDSRWVRKLASTSNRRERAPGPNNWNLFVAENWGDVKGSAATKFEKIAKMYANYEE